MAQRDVRTTAVGRLARLGFTDPEAARRLLDGPALAGLAADEDVVRALAATPDPDLAVTSLDRLLASVSDPGALGDALRSDGTLRERLLGVLGYSAGLGDHLARHPEDWHVLAGWPGAGSDVGDVVPDQEDATPPRAEVRAELLRAVGADPESPWPDSASTGEVVKDALRLGYRRRLLRLAADDLTGSASLERTAAELADLAGAALDAALAIARAEVGPQAGSCRLAVIGMGKCGGRELNYASDVDVVFVVEPAAGVSEEAALRTGGHLAAALIRCCSEATGEGALWPVDAGLRPEGRNGPLVRTLASHLAYYERWAKTWEFQALLKARTVAGDRELGDAYVAAVSPLVWNAAGRAQFVEDVQAMRRRVARNLSREEAERELKLGSGGLRDVEFAVQLLQLVHGRSDETLRSANTLEALRALSAGGYVGREDADSLAQAYRFLRLLEHRIQLYRLRRTHTLPAADADLRRIGRALGFHGDPSGDLTERRRRHAQEVRRLHEKLFYRPLLLAVARLPGDEARLTPTAARARLEALGYADPAGALRHIEALTSGVSRRAAIQRTLLPVLLGWFAAAADPDGGLLGFRKVSDALGATHWYLRLLRDEGAAAQRMAYLLASSRYVTDLLLRAPEAVAMLGDDTELAPRGHEELRSEMVAATCRHDDPEDGVAALRALRRRELFRVAVADLLGLLDGDARGPALSSVAVATLEAGLAAARTSVQRHAAAPLPARFSVIGMGRLGGAEMGYSSDADVLFVYDVAGEGDDTSAARGAHAVAEELRRLLGMPGPDPPLPVDAGLRPEGRDGPLVRSLASYEAYYTRWASAWERQALLRAVPVAGDPDLGERFRALVDPVRYPPGGIDGDALREIRRLKARMEAERLPRGADPTTHLKLGRGGLSDVEWVAQLLQLRNGAAVPALRTPGTLATLAAATDATLLDPADAATLAEAWRAATRVRDVTMLVRGRPSDVVPGGTRERTAVASVLGYPPDRAGELVEDYRRVTRRARAVVERVFFE